jgi:hypothetical protein
MSIAINVAYHMAKKERNMRITFFWAFMFLVLLPLGYATTDPIMDFKQREIGPTLTQQSFERVEPIIKNIRPGQTMDSTGLAWPVIEIKSGNKLVGLVARADGWAGGLSGNLAGAFTKLGEPIALEKGRLYGQHIYGYIMAPSLFVPRYALQTVATVIDKTEYDALTKSRTEGIGWTLKAERSNDKIFFKELKVFQVKELYKSAETFTGMQKGETVSRSEASLLISKERYEQVADKVLTLAPGLDTFSVIKSLNGVFVAQFGGVSYILFMDGFLKYTGEYFIRKTTSQGIYDVWPFGYVENEKEVPKVALIFKNGVVHRVVPYSSKQQIANQLN